MTSVSWANAGICNLDLGGENHFFPSPDQIHTHDGFVTREVPVTLAALDEAYSKGIFPYHWANQKMDWHAYVDDTRRRGILVLNELHLDHNTEKWLRRRELPIYRGKMLANPGIKEILPFTVTFDKAFEEVMLNCANQPRKDENGIVENKSSWISKEHIRAFKKLQQAGLAHSVEVWVHPTGGLPILVGGAYGAFVKGVFSGESMFHKETAELTASYASKVALASLVKHLQTRGSSFLDLQMVTNEATGRMGGKYISIEEYWKMLAEEQKLNLTF